MKATAIYLRVSTVNNQKFDSQEDELKRWIELHTPKKLKWYRDKFTAGREGHVLNNNYWPDHCELNIQVPFTMSSIVGNGKI